MSTHTFDVIVILSKSVRRAGPKARTSKLNSTQGAIYGWWKVKNHLHAD